MIAKIDLEEIFRLTEEFWKSEVKTKAFLDLFKGKEIGHRIADYVDEKTTEMLTLNFDTKFEVNRKGKKVARSMGDIWIKSCGMYNPLNVKAGEAGKNGNPNLVSLKKVIKAIFDGKIDSYYLLIVKMSWTVPNSIKLKNKLPEISSIKPHVYLVDMFDYLDFVTYNSGPGQAMLKEKKFYKAIENGEIPAMKSLEKKIEKMFDLFEDGNKRLLLNRNQTLKEYIKHYKKFVESKPNMIDQEELLLG